MEIQSKILLFLPILVIHFVLMIYTLRILYKTRKTKTLSVAIWVILIIVINIFGSLAYLFWGREYADNKNT